MNTSALPPFPRTVAAYATPAASGQSERLLLSAPEAASMLGMSVRRFHQLRQSLPQPVVLGARHVRWRRAELVAWVECLPANEQARPEPAQLQAGRAARKDRIGDCVVDRLVDFQSSAAESQRHRGTKLSQTLSNRDADTPEA
jgi:predicted DNA-binding transcriptional regulator AlpA